MSYFMKSSVAAVGIFAGAAVAVKVHQGPQGERLTPIATATVPGNSKPIGVTAVGQRLEKNLTIISFAKMRTKPSKTSMY